MITNPRILILGKLPPPYMGPSVATKILLESPLRIRFTLFHVDTKAIRSLSELGKWSMQKVLKNCSIYLKTFRTCLLMRPSLVLLPISQSTIGFLKDSVFILISKITFRKIILQLRGSDFKRWYEARSSLMKFYIRFILKRTNGVIVLGNNLRYIFSDFFPEEKIFVCPNGGNFEVPKTDRRTGQVNILYLANLNAAKGIEDVLQAIKILCAKGIKNFNVDVAGDWLSPELQQSCIELVEKYSLPVSFHPTAAGEAKRKLFGSADIFVFTPREPEGHPWVIVEAMAAALPVLATDRGAIVESVVDGENGFIVPLRSPEHIAVKLELLVNDEALRKKMSAASFRFYKEKFTEEKMVDNLERIFKTVIAG